MGINLNYIYLKNKKQKQKKTKQKQNPNNPKTSKKSKKFTKTTKIHKNYKTIPRMHLRTGQDTTGNDPCVVRRSNHSDILLYNMKMGLYLYYVNYHIYYMFISFTHSIYSKLI